MSADRRRPAKMAISTREEVQPGGSGSRVYGNGGWKAASFIIGVEIAERMAYYGATSNLISYLTGPLGQSTAVAAANTNAWSGTCSMFPLVGAFVADSYLGRYRMILLASFMYILGLGLLTMSTLIPFFLQSHCTDPVKTCSPSAFQVVFFFSSLYLVAIAQGGHKPCVQAFGADQFDATNLQEVKEKSSFFNWWYFGLCSGSLFSVTIMNYIQDNIGWGLGFGIPCIFMGFALTVFMLGTKCYRQRPLDDRNPVIGIAQVFVAAARNWRIPSSSSHEKQLNIDDTEIEVPLLHYSKQYKFLDKAILTSDDQCHSSENSPWKRCSPKQVEDAKTVLRLVPIWMTCLLYGVVFAQSSTLFTKQGSTMDRSIGSNFKVPPASLQTFITVSIMLVIPIYDRILIPGARSFTGLSSGITMLQRIGFGMFLSILSMVVAALIEKKRLDTARDYEVIDIPTATVPMSVWWLVPQYMLFGTADVFTMVGLQEFFYDQVPDSLRSLGLALSLSIFGVGSFLSSFLISLIQRITVNGNGESWFTNNLNHAHLDYFYWVLAMLSIFEFAVYVYFAKSYIYKQPKVQPH